MDVNLFSAILARDRWSSRRFFVGFVVHWKTLDVLKAARVLALSNRQRLQLLSAVHVAG